ARQEQDQVVELDMQRRDLLDREQAPLVMLLDATLHTDVHARPESIDDIIDAVPHPGPERAVRVRQLKSEVALTGGRTADAHRMDREARDDILEVGLLECRRPGELVLADPLARSRVAAHVRCADASCTTRPPTIVNTARPRSRLPANGVLRLFERKCDGSTVHSKPGSNTVTSAGAARRNVPPGRLNAAAGAVLMRMTSVGRSMTSFATSSVTASPSAVSSPTRPNGASSNACSFSS